VAWAIVKGIFYNYTICFSFAVSPNASCSALWPAACCFLTDFCHRLKTQAYLFPPIISRHFALTIGVLRILQWNGVSE